MDWLDIHYGFLVKAFLQMKENIWKVLVKNGYSIEQHLNIFNMNYQGVSAYGS